ncbi:CocE/NonD family hydrolase [Nonomuraea sp. NPDC050310]|uniref:alpha/beta hydrolase family protein n=1 Tax=unclassified Nonomuraea TaxID=2593643 RepID=UPI0033FA5939
MSFGPHLGGRFDVSHDLQAHVYRRTLAELRRWHAVNDALATPEDVRARQAAIRAQVLASLGGLPDVTGAPPSVDLPDERGVAVEAEECGVIDLGDIVVEKLLLTTAPGVVVPANLWRPAEVREPAGAVLFACGHGPEAKAHPTYQAVCARLARAGLIALATDPFGQGERAATARTDGGVSEHTDAGVQCWWLGHSVARYFVHDARRAIDYLSARPDVDPARIGMTGNSGGGTITTLLMALEPRLAAAAPGTFVTGREAYLWSGQAQDAEQVLPGATLGGVDHEDFLLAMAPRPTLVLAADYDFFPIEGTVRSVRRARRAFGLLGAADRLRLVRSEVGHGFFPELARAATAFLAEHLGGRVTDEREPEPLPEHLLRCTAKGIFADRPDTRHPRDLNLAHLPDAGRDWTGWLAERVHAHRTPPEEFFPRWFDRHVFWRSEADLWNCGVLHGDPEGARELVIALGEPPEPGPGRLVLAIDVRGTGALAPAPVNARAPGYFDTTFKLATDLLWLGDSLAAGRVFDVLRAVGFAWRDERLAACRTGLVLYGAGPEEALLVTLAARLEPRVRAVEGAAPLDPRAAVAAGVGEPAYGWQAVIPGLAARLAPGELRG